MTNDAPPRLNVQVQLALQVDDLRAAVTADGSQITLRTDDVSGLLTEVTRACANAPAPRPSMRQLAGATARVLDTNGLSARLVGGHGTVIEFGSDCCTRGARLLFADAHVRIGRPSALFAEGLDLVRTSPTIRRRAWHAVTGLVAVVAIGRLRHVRFGWP